MIRAGRIELPAWVVLAMALAVTAAVFAQSLASALQQLGGSSSASLAALAPLAAVAAALVATARGGAPEQLKLEPAMLGAVPALLAGVLLSVFGPARLGFEFWYLRFDLVGMLAFAAGCMMLAVGVRAVTRHGAIVVMLLALPPLVMPLARGAESVLGGAVRVIAEKLALALPLGARPLSGGDFLVDGDARVSVAAACAGVDGLLVVALLAAPFCVATRGRARAKLLAVGVALVAAWLLNIVRVTVLLALAGHGQTAAFEAVHDWFGLLIVLGVTATLVLTGRRLGLALRFTGLRSRVSYTPRHALVGTLVVLAAATLVALGMVTLASAGLRSADVERRVVVAQDESAADGVRRLHLQIPGYDVRHDGTFDWFRPFFGPGSQAGEFTVVRENDPPMWAQVLTSRSRRKLEQYAPLDCFVAHGARILRVRRVALPGGAGMLVDQRLRGRSFTALSWTQAVVLPDGRDGHRRVVLFADAEGLRGDSPDQRYTEAASGFERVVYAALNVLSPAAERPLGDWSYGPPGRRLVRLAQEMIEHGA